MLLGRMVQGRRPTARLCALLILAATALAALPAAASAAKGSLPSVASGHRPGPDVLYAPAAGVPQLQNAGVWKAPPILISGASAYRRGEFLYQDFLYDDHGAAGATDPSDPFNPVEFLFSPKHGTATYPTDPAFANNSTDLVELRVKRDGGATAFRVTLNTLRAPERTAFTIALGSSAAPLPWPHAAGVRSPAQLFLTVHGATAELRDAQTGSVQAPAPNAVMDTRRRQVEVRVPHAAWNPGTGKVRMAAGVGLWDPAAGAYLTPTPGAASAARPGGGAPSGAALFNMAFRFDEPMPKISEPGVINTTAEGGAGADADGSWWRERAQGDALATGDVSRFNATVDFGKLAAGATDESGVPRTGPMNRILGSRLSFGDGVDHEVKCATGGIGRDTPVATGEVCNGRFLGQLQPYAVYVPKKPAPARGFGITLLMHGLSANHNEFLDSKNASQFGERGTGSIVASPYGRGPDGFYANAAETDVFEMWADLARHYKLDSGHASLSGYSMGGGGTYRLASRYPDLFARGFPIVGIPQAALVPSLRNIPIMAWNAAQDELVNVALSENGRQELSDAGIGYEQWLFNPAGHITLGNNDEYGPPADFLGSHRVDRNPPHVTYVSSPRDDFKPGGAVGDHAYWVSEVRLRDATAERATVDARSLGFGVGDPPQKPLDTSSGTLEGGSHGPLPYARRAELRGPAPTTAKVNRLDVKATNVASATVDVRRARLGCGADVRIESDGPTVIRLAGCGVSVAATRCLSRKVSVGGRGIGRVRLGRTRARLVRGKVKPRRRARLSVRYCVRRSRGTVRSRVLEARPSRQGATGGEHRQDAPQPPRGRGHLSPASGARVPPPAAAGPGSVPRRSPQYAGGGHTARQGAVRGSGRPPAARPAPGASALPAPRRALAAPVHRVHGVGPAQPLQGQLLRRQELRGEIVAGRVLPELLGHDDLAPARPVGDPRGEDHVAPEVVLAVLDHEAGVQPHPHTEALVGIIERVAVERMLHLDRTGQRGARAHEGEHEAVALRLHLRAVVRLHQLAHDPVVLAEQGEPRLVAEALDHLRRAFDVAEQDRDRPVGRATPTEVHVRHLDEVGYLMNG